MKVDHKTHLQCTYFGFFFRSFRKCTANHHVLTQSAPQLRDSAHRRKNFTSFTRDLLPGVVPHLFDTSQTSLNLWPPRCCFGCGNIWKSFGDQFTDIIDYKIIRHVNLLFDQSSLIFKVTLSCPFFSSVWSLISHLPSNILRAHLSCTQLFNYKQMEIKIAHK